MFLLILKSSACLATLMVFYKLCLEKESIHHFKRFYLLGALFLSIGIPFISFTGYVEALANIGFPKITSFNNASKNPTYLSSTLWVLYIIGVVCLTFRFVWNIKSIFYKIKLNSKRRQNTCIHVLLHDNIQPHVFFNYIFFNKKEYENNLIPIEILFHEKTHAKEKHTIDIILIELLQIIFWFNPLLYLIKKDIKLNHEFLADQAVIKNGVNAKNYQLLLLKFSSNNQQHLLASAINYSLIKKRFTVMKTQSSKKTLLLASLIFIPILGSLIYSCGNNTANLSHETDKVEEVIAEEVEEVEEVEERDTNFKRKQSNSMKLTAKQEKKLDDYIKKHPESVKNGIVEIPSDLFSNTNK